VEASILSVKGILGYNLVTSAVTSWEPGESGPVGNREIKSWESIRDPGIFFRRLLVNSVIYLSRKYGCESSNNWASRECSTSFFDILVDFWKEI
jgi:hypothetical protein